jgi:hypothetical protein
MYYNSKVNIDMSRALGSWYLKSKFDSNWIEK